MRFDESQGGGAPAIEAHLGAIFADHKPASYIAIVREVRLIGDEVGWCGPWWHQRPSISDQRRLPPD